MTMIFFLEMIMMIKNRRRQLFLLHVTESSYQWSFVMSTVTIMTLCSSRTLMMREEEEDTPSSMNISLFCHLSLFSRLHVMTFSECIRFTLWLVVFLSLFSRVLLSSIPLSITIWHENRRGGWWCSAEKLQPLVSPEENCAREEWWWAGEDSRRKVKSSRKRHE